MAMNDTLGPGGLVPSALVFREFPQMYALSKMGGNSSTFQERSDIADTARQRMRTQMARLKEKRAFHHATPLSCARSYQPSEKILVWREKIVANRIAELSGLFEVAAFDSEKKTNSLSRRRGAAPSPIQCCLNEAVLHPRDPLSPLLRGFAPRTLTIQILRLCGLNSDDRSHCFTRWTRAVLRNE